MKTNIFFTFGSLFLFLIFFAGGRILLQLSLVESEILPQAVISELLIACALILVAGGLCKINIFFGAFFLIFFSLFHTANMEMILSMRTVIQFQDVLFGAKTEFFRGSFLNSIFIPYFVVLSFTAILFTIFSGPLKRIKMRYYIFSGISIFLLVIFVIPSFTLTHGGEDWKTSSLVFSSINKSLQNNEKIKSEENTEVSDHSPSYQTVDTLSHLEIPESHKQYNVLVIILEGMAGPYLRQVQEFTNVNYPIIMEKLSNIAEDFVIVPNIVSHNRQTIRGLYAMLTGDYPELNLVTPRAYKFLSLPSGKRPAALPAVLKAAGYETHFLQGADLSYMSKDQFMDAAGFENIAGSEYFENQYIPFSWGPDDKAFFEGALKKIETLNKKNTPWFLSLLNVGTHHPYAVTEKMASKYPNKVVASIQNLDNVFKVFYEKLKRNGYLKNTIIAVVSDESHGLAGQPFGRFWPLAMIRIPETIPKISKGRYGLIDIKWTILKNLGLSDQVDIIPRYDMIEDSDTSERLLLFEKFASVGTGTVYEVFSDKKVKVYRNKKGRLFADSYNTEILPPEKAEEIISKIVEKRAKEKSRFALSTSKIEQYKIIKDTEYKIKAGQAKMLSTGQYIDISGNCITTIDISVKFLSSGKNYQGNRTKLFLQLVNKGKELDLPDFSIPQIYEGNKLKFSFSFNVKEPLEQLWTVLSARNYGREQGGTLKIEEFTLSHKPGNMPVKYRENSKEIIEKNNY